MQVIGLFVQILKKNKKVLTLCEKNKIILKTCVRIIKDNENRYLIKQKEQTMEDIYEYSLANRTIVKVSNTLNEAKYKLSANAIDVLNLFLTQIYTEDREFRKFRIDIKDIEKKLGKRINTKTIDNICKELMSNPIRIEEIEDNLNIPESIKRMSDTYYYKKESAKKTINYYNWASKASYNVAEKWFELEIHEGLKTHLLQLKKNFTKYSFNQIKNLKSQYSKRLYMLLKRFMNTEKPFYTVSVEDLLYILDVEDKYGKYFNDFRRKVLKVALDQINESSDINVSCKEIKKGRKIVRLEFKMNYKEEREEELNKKSFERAQRKRKTRSYHKSGVLEMEEWLKRKQAEEAEEVIDTDIVSRLFS